jgi:hypothetical protein
MKAATRTPAGPPGPANANARQIAGAGKRLETARKLQSRSRLVKQLELLRRRFWQGNVTARASIIKIMEGAL